MRWETAVCTSTTAIGCVNGKHTSAKLIVTPEIVDLFWLTYLARRME